MKFDASTALWLPYSLLHSRVVSQGPLISYLMVKIKHSQGIPEGLELEIMEIPKGRGVNNNGISKALGEGELSILIPPLVEYGYFLESHIKTNLL